MKLKYSLFLIVVFFSCSTTKKLNQTDTITVVISGTTKDLIAPKIYLTTPDYKKTIYRFDTIKEGKFSGKIVLPYSGFYKIFFEGSYPPDSLATGFKHTVNLYLENQIQYNIDGGTDRNISMDKTKVYSGSSIQDELSTFDDLYFTGMRLIMSELNNKKYERAMSLKNNGDNKENEAMLKDIERTEETLKRYTGKFVRGYAIKHPGSVVAIHFLSIAYDLKENYTQYLDVYNHLRKRIKNQADGILFKKTLDSIKK